MSFDAVLPERGIILRVYNHSMPKIYPWYNCTWTGREYKKSSSVTARYYTTLLGRWSGYRSSKHLVMSKYANETFSRKEGKQSSFHSMLHDLCERRERLSKVKEHRYQPEARK